MCNTRFGHFLLSWVLLLSLTAGFAIHDHDASGAGDYACAEQHQAADHHDRGMANTLPSRWHEAGPLHEHHCLGCHFHGKRHLPRPLQCAALPLDVQVADLVGPTQGPRAQPLRAGGSLRGPPLS